MGKYLTATDQNFKAEVLFSAVRRTLHSFGYTHFGAETGAVALLHSWGQNLSLHPHIHCLIPAVGYNLKGKWKHIGSFQNYLYPVHKLSKAFKGKFLDSIKRELRKHDCLEGFTSQLEKAESKKWVVYCEPSMAQAKQVMHYLGQYTHRVAISNKRIVKVTDTHVTFIAKDYRDRAVQKPVTLEGVEFLRRFCLHIMPPRFVRIRRFGIYNHTTKRNLKLQFVPVALEKSQEIEKKAETKQERMIRLIGYDPYKCPVCKEGNLIAVEIVPRIRSPASHVPSMLYNVLK